MPETTPPETQAVLDHLATDREAALDRLKDLLTIPSVSTDSAFDADIQRAAEWTAATLRDAGLDARVEPTDGKPCVVATTPEADLMPHAVDGPTVLYYGHYDVQPADPIEKWDTPPFEPTVRDGKLYARGASDDKGQVMTFVEAFRAWKQQHGKFPVRATVLIEGEEECGSVNFQPFIAANKDMLKADVAVISDTAMWNEQTVSITYGLRGLIYFDIQLHGPRRDLHSGVFGGVLANPATMIARVVGKLFDDDNRVTIPGFYDDVLPPTDEERKLWAKLGFDEMSDCLSPIGVDTPFGERGFTTLERRWARPSCDVNGLYGGYQGEGAKTVIPSYAGAKVSMRLAYNQDPHKIAEAFEAWLRSHDVGGCEWKLTNHGVAEPVMVAADSPFVTAAQRGIHATSGREAALVREGATIPVIADFKTTLGVDSLLVGFGLHDDCLHAPNEKFNLSCFELGCRTHAAMMWELGQVRS